MRVAFLISPPDRFPARPFRCFHCQNAAAAGRKQVMTKLMRLRLVAALLAFAALAHVSRAATRQWSVEQAEEWYEKQPWLVGCNFGPSNAINQLEMWQPDTFDLKTIDRELGWAEDLGFTSVRVFLHHLLWEQDADGLLKRMDQFLNVANKHKIGVMFVLFDSVWDPSPRLGKQRAPKPGLHNSGWVQSPGIKDLQDKARWGLLEAYVKGVVGRFHKDDRVDAWDLFNEPDNTNDNSYGEKGSKKELDKEKKHALSLELLNKTFSWAREASPTQPLTSGVWRGDWSSDATLTPMEKAQLDNSDVISFHSYDPMEQLKKRVETLRRYKRPLLCTEYMARPRGSTFEPMLAYFKEEKVAAYNWGFVQGKTNTIYPWDSWEQAYAGEPPVWFHDIFRTDGTPYRPEEVEYIRRITGKAAGK